MQPWPADRWPDSSLALLSQGYSFTLRRYARFGTDAFLTRLMLSRALVARGEDAAQMFYTPGRFTRRGGIPKPALWSLQDVHSVMALDGAAHHHRKALFMALLNGEAPRLVADGFAVAWEATLPQLRAQGEFKLLHVARLLLTRALCAWAGVPLAPGEATRRAGAFGAMVEGAGTVGPRNWRGLGRRFFTERWVRGLLDEVRRGTRHPPPESPLAVIAHHRDFDGRPLALRTAGEELINCIRPAVANDRYIVFAAHALHCHPHVRAALDDGSDEAALERFANEVRRFYPFIPVMGGRALQRFEWRGRTIEKGDWVLLDLYGTNHDQRLWEAPARFDPDRFRERPPGAYDLVSHGAGDANRTHRCPGERMTVEIIKRATQILLRTDYVVPPQNFAIRLSRIPAVPESRFRMRLA